MIRDQMSFPMRSFINDLQSIIKESNGSESNISHIAKFCLTKGPKSQSSELEVAKTFENFITGEVYMLELKMIVLQVMTEILIENSNKNFVRHLSSRLQVFLCTCKYEIAENSSAVRTMKSIFNKWKTSKVFSELFYEKLVSLAGPNLMDKIENEVEPFEFTRYSRTALLGYRDVDRVKCTSIAFKAFKKAKKLTHQVQEIANKKENLVNLPKAQRNLSVKEMLKFTDKLIEQHLQTLLELQQGNQEIVSLFKDQVKALNIPQSQLLQVQNN